MHSARRLQSACQRCHNLNFAQIRTRCPSALAQRHVANLTPVATRTSRTFSRPLSTTRYFCNESQASSESQSQNEIEKIVRDAKQRFRDTLPKGYLSAEEYELYERLYGPPLRETRPEDVGIDTHEDMGAEERAEIGTLLRELDSGEFEELRYTVDPSGEREIDSELVNDLVKKAPGYVDIISRNQREFDALQKLSEDYQVTKKQEEEQRKADRLRRIEEMQVDEEIQYDEEPEQQLALENYESGEAKRFHPLTLEGRFNDSPVEIQLPQDELVEPIRQLLERTHIQHVKAAAESAFGGPGLPTSPVTLEGMKNGRMGGIGLPPDQKQMTEIEADAFLAGFVPPAYASVMSILREVRKRVGSDWIQSRLKDGGLSVLDAGTGGAGLIAWEQIQQAEWQLLKDKKQVTGATPPGKKTTIVSSDRLRHRMKAMLDNTTFLPRLPDYEHSGPMQGTHLDSSGQHQKRKTYDIVIASHLFLKEQKDHYRQAILNNLWNVLSKDGGVLIVIEKAHPRGFEAVAHVRDTITKQFLLPESGKPELSADDFNPAFHRELEAGHIVAPCTNQGTCPMYQEPGKSKGRKDFCHFSQRFVQPSYYSKVLGRPDSNQGEVEFSYIAVQRGFNKDTTLTGQEATDAAFKGYEATDEKPNMKTLPRIIRPPIKRKGHATLDVCTAEGRAERWTVPKSFSKLAYHDARKSRWGDLWALGAKTRVPRTVRAGAGKEDGVKRAAGEKKARRGKRSTEEEVENLPRERKTKSEKNRDLVHELLAAEEMAEDAIEQELDAELEEVEEQGRR